MRNLKNVLDVEPLHFKDYAEFEAYVRHPGYEVDEARPGMCTAIEVI